VLEGVIPPEIFPLAEWHSGELADVPRFTVLKTQICVTRPQCVKRIEFVIRNLSWLFFKKELSSFYMSKRTIK